MGYAQSWGPPVHERSCSMKRAVSNDIYADRKRVLYGDPDTTGAVNFAISLLRPDRLSDQECFKTEKALECLHFVRSYEVGIR